MTPDHAQQSCIDIKQNNNKSSYSPHMLIHFLLNALPSRVWKNASFCPFLFISSTMEEKTLQFISSAETSDWHRRWRWRRVLHGSSAGLSKCPGGERCRRLLTTLISAQQLMHQPASAENFSHVGVKLFSPPCPQQQPCLQVWSNYTSAARLKTPPLCFCFFLK